MTTLDKLVEGATKIKLAPPKPKYVEPILMSTADGVKSDNFRTVMRALRRRLGDSAWTIVYKSLVVIHIMIREGESNVTLEYLASHPDIFTLRIGADGRFIDNGGSLRQLKAYSHYLTVRGLEFGKTHHDFIKETKKPFGGWDISDKTSILRDLTVEKGLLMLTESIQLQITALLKCTFQESEVNNDLLILSFRMLSTDLVSLYQTLNEGVLNILEHFFELSKPDAQRAFDIYVNFTNLTKQVVAFLRVAKHLEKITKAKVPVIRHAQTSLTDSLKAYLDDPDFDITRRQYLAEREFVNVRNKSASPSKKQLQPPQQQQFKNVSPEKPLPKEPSQPVDNLLNLQDQFQQQHAAQVQVQVQGQGQGQLSQPQLSIPAVPIVQMDTGLPFQQTGFNPFTNMNMMSFSNQPAQMAAVSEQPALLLQQQFTSQQNLPHINAQFTQQPAQLQPQFTQPIQPHLVHSMTHQFTAQPTIPETVPLQQQFTSQTNAQPVAAAPQSFNSIPAPAPAPANTSVSVQPNLLQSSTYPQQLHQQFSNLTLNHPSSASAMFANTDKNPFSPSKTLANNPFAIKPQKLSKEFTGTNPFRMETVSESDKVKPGVVTAGGLERLATIPVFPETKREALRENTVNAQFTGGFGQQQQPQQFIQQATGGFGQQQQPQQFTQQATGGFGQQQQPQQFTQQATGGFGQQQQPQQFTQQATGGFGQQQQPQQFTQQATGGFGQQQQPQQFTQQATGGFGQQQQPQQFNQQATGVFAQPQQPQQFTQQATGVFAQPQQPQQFTQQATGGFGQLQFNQQAAAGFAQPQPQPQPQHMAGQQTIYNPYQQQATHSAVYTGPNLLD
ncbi:Yap1801 protein [Martiniozyma asiatica (nom. inval.)]|nr:Yap1801 protein [Martiniozyma asiatica]